MVGVGLHILFSNLDRAATQLSRLLDTSAGKALGILPSVVLAVSHAMQAYALDHQGFLQNLLRILISFWPLLFVVVGTVLLRDFFVDNVTLPTAEK
jgi:hypothetical protein